MKITKEKQLITALYIAIYNRAPEESGLLYWSDRLAQGDSYESIINGFIDHPVFLDTYGSLNNLEKVDAFYHNILGNKGDQTGIEYWTERLDSGDSLSLVLADFLRSSLEINLSTAKLSPEDLALASIRQDTLNNKIEAGVFYAEGMGFWGELNGDINSLAIKDTDEYLSAAAAIKNIDHTDIKLQIAKANIEKDNFFFKNPEGGKSIAEKIEELSAEIQDSPLADFLTKPIDPISPLDWTDFSGFDWPSFPNYKDTGWGGDPFTIETTTSSITNPDGSITITTKEIKTNQITGAISESVSVSTVLSASASNGSVAFSQNSNLLLSTAKFTDDYTDQEVNDWPSLAEPVITESSAEIDLIGQYQHVGPALL